MAIVRQGGDVGFMASMVGNFNVQMHREQTRNLMAGFQNQFALLTDAGKAAFEKVNKVFSSENNWNALEAAGTASRSLWDSTAVQYLSTPESFIDANQTMRSFLMTNDYIWSQYKSGVLEGWDSDFAMSDDGRGVDSYDWRRANSGMVHVHESGDWEVTNYTETENDELSFGEKVIIGESINNALSRITKLHRDPTSYFNSKI